MSSPDCVVSGFENVDPTMVQSVTISGVTLTFSGVQIPALSGSWSASTNPYITGFEFQYLVSSGTVGYSDSTAKVGALSWIATNGVLAGATYNLRYRAVGTGVVGPWSSWVSVTAPSAFVAGSSVTVTWSGISGTPANLASLTGSEPILNSLIPAIGVNRVRFSLFEKGAYDGWTTNTSGSATTTYQGSYGGYSLRKISATSTAAGQVVAQDSDPFAVTELENLAVEALVELQATGWQGYIQALFYDASDTFLSVSTPYSNPYNIGSFPAGTAYGTSIQGFVTVPPGAYYMRFRIQATSLSAGASLVGLTLVQPFVSGAAVGQTTFPAFSAGPSSEAGADVTANYTAAAITGQAPAATDATIQSGATKNVVTIGATAPTSPTNGDLWNDTSTTPGTWKAYFASTWVVVSSLGGVFSSTLYEAVGGSVATLSNFKTVLGTAAAITGQSPWATTGIPTSILTNPTANLVYNPAAALGAQGWAAYTGLIWEANYGAAAVVASYFYNTSASNVSGVSQYQDVPCDAGFAYSLQAMISSPGLTASAVARCYVEWIDSSGAHISYAAVAQVAGGNGWTYVTAPNQVAPAGAVVARVWIDIDSLSAWTNTNCAWSNIKLENNTVCSPYSDETTNGALYRDGNTIDALQPAQVGADVTGYHTAAGISGQGALATQNSVTWLTEITGLPSNLSALAGTEAIQNSILQGNLTSGAVTPAVAASITGQGSLATANDVVWATQVTGVGKPADNATASVVYIQQTTPSSANVDDIWILTNGSGVTQAVYAYNGSSWVLGADITGLNVAASITGQGALATQNTVNPGQITSGAVSSTPTAFTSGTTSLYAGSPGAGSTSTIQSFTTTTGAGIVTLSWSLSAAYYSGTSAPTLIMELYRDGTLINGATAPNGTNPFQSQTCQDLPGAGSHTYTLKAFAAGYGGRVDVSNIELIGSVILA